MAFGCEITRIGYREFSHATNQAKRSWHFFFSIWAVTLWDFQHRLNSLDNFVDAFLWSFEMSMNGCALANEVGKGSILLILFGIQQYL